jgi:DNA mismatch repair protein MutS
MAQKVVEFYIETLKEYKKKLNKDKVTLLMQVGEFFEIYGLIYPDNRREGNIWEFCDNVNLKIADKKQDVYGDPNIQVLMGGVGISYINPYIQKAVDRFGWTVVIFEQFKIGNTQKFERKETSIISPGININSDSNTFSNITMIIYIEQIKTYYRGNSQNLISRNNNKYNKINDYQVNIGLSFIDCLTGANGVMSINNSSTSDISIPFDELLKLLTIKNPNELIIYIQNSDEQNQELSTSTSTSISTSTSPFGDEELINALHLFNYQFKIIRETIDDKYSNLNYQSKIFDTIYKKHRGILDIMQQLDIEGAEHNYSRIALTLLLEFINNHDKTIIEKLGRPEIMLNSDKYLMLANNCLEQLDIIDNMKSNEELQKTNAKRISLLDLLDNTKTPLGKILLRQRLSIPITESHILEERYKLIGELEDLHNKYMVLGETSSNSSRVSTISNISNISTISTISSTSRISNMTITNDKYGSPLHQLRMKLTGIKNIDNYLRKIITQKIQPNDIGTYIDSLEKCIKTYEFVKELNLSSFSNTSNTSNKSLSILKNLHNSFISDINLEALKSSNIWTTIESNPFNRGISHKLDELQDEINTDQTFLDNLILELSKILEPKFNTETSKPIIFTGENASKGIHIYTNKTRKDALETYFAKANNQNQIPILKIGTYKITSKEIKYTQLKESKWEIDISYLKSSNGTLKTNIEKMGKIVKAEFINWLNENIVENTETLDALGELSYFIGEIDLLQSNVLNAVDKGYTSPIIDSTKEHSFFNASMLRHPIIENITTKTKYVPNDVSMGAESDCGILLFGVNAVGKSSLMKSIGINIIMAQAGMYVASSKFTYKPYKYLFTRIRNNDNIYAGLSSFEVEMKEFKVILKYANQDSIILGDELCSGTETQDATALVASGIGLLSKRKSSFIFATHLHFLADMNYIKDLSNIRLCHMAVELDPSNPKKLVYSRKIQEGSGPKSYGILVCESMDLDEEFITKAKEIRQNMQNMHNMHNIHQQTNTILNSSKIGSKYNANKIIGICEVCNDKTATDVHHINQQCDANHNNLIESEEYGIFNKNKLWNLVALCKDCHQGVHSSPPKIEITGYINTSNGLELQTAGFSKIRAQTLERLKPLSIENVHSIENIELDEMETLLDKNKNININIRKFILDMKLANNTPKKIQCDLKKYHKIEKTQQEIRDFV